MERREDGRALAAGAWLAAATSVLAMAGGCGAGPTTKPPVPAGTVRPAASPGGPGSAGTPADYDDVDVVFAQTMVRHADQGVALSELVLDQVGVDPSVLTLARTVVASQRAESEELRRWLLGHGLPVRPTPAPGVADGVAGTATLEQVRRLQRADAERAGPLYVELMTRHHSGAVAAASDEAARGKDEALVDLAHRLVQAQQVQLDTLRRSSAAAPPTVPGLTPPSGQVTLPGR